jgi:hypothetical protein
MGRVLSKSRRRHESKCAHDPYRDQISGHDSLLNELDLRIKNLNTATVPIAKQKYLSN